MTRGKKFCIEATSELRCQACQQDDEKCHYRFRLTEPLDIDELDGLEFECDRCIDRSQACQYSSDDLTGVELKRDIETEIRGYYERKRQSSQVVIDDTTVYQVKLELSEDSELSGDGTSDIDMDNDDDEDDCMEGSDLSSEAVEAQEDEDHAKVMDDNAASELNTRHCVTVSDSTSHRRHIGPRAEQKHSYISPIRTHTEYIVAARKLSAISIGITRRS